MIDLPKLHPKEFSKKFNGDIVFVSDMGDLFSNGVLDEWIIKVIEYIRKFTNTLFLFLTKNKTLQELLRFLSTKRYPWCYN